MTKAMRGRLGPYTYLSASNPAAAKGTLSNGGLPVTLEVTEDVLQEFMDTMSALERDLSRRWASTEYWFSGTRAE
ncbi:hypothetical protein GCM10010503_31240 [Streptomyces lucensis JCM 4490]|uniref:Uncharacterized protein n=1 Tax=Streptomyces lucensis JCM 4490 TaxID=1306176 RepID=A0A918J6N5_9ACTN|nr:hypothetical protein GCM10010503_31240 [Streptomyces lucensis JCM 4490]